MLKKHEISNLRSRAVFWRYSCLVLIEQKQLEQLLEGVQKTMPLLIVIYFYISTSTGMHLTHTI